MLFLQTSGAPLPLPPKKVFGNMDNTFIAERLLGLQQYLNSITQEPMFVRHECFKRFMDPKNYPANMQGLEMPLSLAACLKITNVDSV